tara:strand:+ start:1028 stop:1498 length:471 start_codon:yes stop_codon:yes gene_type:complete
MATTHKVTWSVSATPKVIVDAVDGASLETVSLHENIRKSLGGNGQLSYAGAIDYGGVTDGGTNYLQATNSGVLIGNADTRFIWIKHTGYLWISSSVLGEATTDKININADAEHIATLKAGEAWIIPLTDTSTTIGIGFLALRGGSSDIAIEAIGLD